MKNVLRFIVAIPVLLMVAVIYGGLAKLLIVTFWKPALVVIGIVILFVWIGSRGGGRENPMTDDYDGTG